MSWSFFCSDGTGLTDKNSSSPINRVKFLMPWLLATGDDDGVIKVCYSKLTLRAGTNLVSYGTLANKNLLDHIRGTSTILRTSCGWTTKDKSSQQGE